MREVRESLKTILFLDGSDVGIEQQVTEVAKNQYLHNLTVSIMNSQFPLLQTAISERV
jgi:flagellar basal-body rod protein FlgB